MKNEAYTRHPQTPGACLAHGMGLAEDSRSTRAPWQPGALRFLEHMVLAISFEMPGIRFSTVTTTAAHRASEKPFDFGDAGSADCGLYGGRFAGFIWDSLETIVGFTQTAKNTHRTRKNTRRESHPLCSTTLIFAAAVAFDPARICQAVSHRNCSGPCGFHKERREPGG